MANWWEQAPLSGQAGGDKWWNAAPLANEQRTFKNDVDEELYRQTVARIKNERSKPRVPFSGDPTEQMSPEQAAIHEVQQKRRQQAEQSAFDASRTPLTRAVDTANFIASVPVRALTQGQYGIGDVMGLVDQQSGDYAKQAEGNFARANQGWLEPVAKGSELLLGVPALEGIGVVPGQLANLGKAAVRQVPGMNRLLASAPTVAAPTATAAQAYGPAQRIADRAAFQAEGIPEFAPAFASKGVARTARTIEEAPLVGGTVKVPKTAVEQAVAQRQSNLATNAGAAQSAEEVGRVTQGGLNRFRGSDLQDLERSRVQQLGINPDRPPQNIAGNVNVNRPSQLNTATMTPAELDAAAASRVNLPGSTRSTVEDLSPQEVQRIVDLPARDTSFATKASALYRQAEDAVPTIMTTNNRANAGLLATRNSGRVAEGLMRQEQSAAISGGVLEGRFGQLVQRLANPQSNFTMSALRAARTEVGRALSSFGEFDARLDRTQLKQLYGAISDDYQSGLVALAARARRIANASPGNADLLQTANAADRALQRYRVADRYYRQGIERMDRFMKVLGADTMEQASRRISQYLRENTQNIGALRSIFSSLRPEESRAIFGNVIQELGRLTPGAREAERVFSFERFATDWNKISQNPQVIDLFRRTLGDQVVRSLQNLGRISERMKFYETTKNYSGSAYTGFAGLGAATLFNPSMWPALIASIAGTGILGKVLTSRAFARWVNSVNTAQVQVGSSLAATRQALRPHLQRLLSLAAKEPDPSVAAAMGALGYLIDQQLKATNPEAATTQP